MTVVDSILNGSVFSFCRQTPCSEAHSGSLVCTVDTKRRTRMLIRWLTAWYSGAGSDILVRQAFSTRIARLRQPGVKIFPENSTRRIFPSWLNKSDSHGASRIGPSAPPPARPVAAFQSDKQNLWSATSGRVGGHDAQCNLCTCMKSSYSLHRTPYS